MVSSAFATEERVRMYLFILSFHVAFCNFPEIRDRREDHFGKIFHKIEDRLPNFMPRSFSCVVLVNEIFVELDDYHSPSTISDVGLSSDEIPAASAAAILAG